MSISEAQYYQAKVFLEALSQAHTALEQAAKQKAEINRLKCFQKHLVSGIAAQQIKLTDVGVYRNKHFDRTQIKQLSNFTNIYFQKRLGGFTEAKNFTDLSQVLRKSLD